MKSNFCIIQNVKFLHRVVVDVENTSVTIFGKAFTDSIRGTGSLILAGFLKA